jgi:hypothetical protein
MKKAAGKKSLLRKKAAEKVVHLKKLRKEVVAFEKAAEKVVAFEEAAERSRCFERSCGKKSLPLHFGGERRALALRKTGQLRGASSPGLLLKSQINCVHAPPKPACSRPRVPHHAVSLFIA